MKLLISPRDEKEAVDAIEGGADIIDVKNPEEGALGANYPWVIRRIKEITPKHVEVSCTIGDVPTLFGTVSLAALGAATTGVDYIKTGLHGLKAKEDAIELMRTVRRAIKEYNSSIKVVAIGYADVERAGSVNPLSIPEIAHKAEADLAMLDTAVKDGKNLFTFLTNIQLRQFVEEAHGYGLKVALAGSLRKGDLSTVRALGADIVGLRGAACTNGDRLHGRITGEKVRELAKAVKILDTSKALKF